MNSVIQSYESDLVRLDFLRKVKDYCNSNSVMYSIISDEIVIQPKPEDEEKVMNDLSLIFGT